jgi:hypothetical protein
MMMVKKGEAMKGSVALVLDPEFGEQLLELAKEMPVWLVSSPVNSHAAELARPKLEEGRITTILTRANESTAALLARALYAIDEHHGEASQAAPYSELCVRGASEHLLSSELISELGLQLVRATPEGFVVNKQTSIGKVT